MGFLIASCSLGQVGKWFKLVGIFGPYPRPHFIFFLTPLFQIPCPLGLSLDCPVSHTETSFSGLPFWWEKERSQAFPSQYVRACTPLPRDFAHWFSIHLLSKSVLDCFVCASYKFNRNFVKIISWLFINNSFKFQSLREISLGIFFLKNLTSIYRLISLAVEPTAVIQFTWPSLIDYKCPESGLQNWGGQTW